MEAVALQLVETTDVGNRALSVADQAKLVKVIDSETYKAAGFIWKSLKDMMKEVDVAWDKNIKLWHEGHKNALADKAKYYQPLDMASRTVKKLMSDYDQAQERIRKAEEKRLADIAQKLADEQALLDAIDAEAEALKNGATKEEAAQEAAAIIAEPVYVPPVILQKTTPKLQGGPVFQTRWDFEITDEDKIPRQFMVPDLVKIRQIVTAMKGQTAIPGVRAFEKRV